MKNILIIDDNPSDSLIAQRVCENLGFTADTASEGFTGLDLCSSRRYNLIIVDLQMPQMSGLQLLNRLKHQNISLQTPVLIMSARSQESDIKRTLLLGASDYIVKPIDPMIFKNKVQKLTEESEADWTYYDVPPQLQKAKIQVDVQLVKISEVGIVVQSNLPIKASESAEFAEFYSELLNEFELSNVVVKWAACVPKDKNYLIHYKFVGLKESQLKRLRLACRKIWGETQKNKEIES